MIIKLNDISKKFGTQNVIENLSLEIKENEFVAIVGKSGCGKSTLLNIIGLLDKPDSGVVELFSQKNIKPFSKQATEILRNEVGYLFQNFALLEDKTVRYNLLLSVDCLKMDDKDAKIKEVLEIVGLKGYENKEVFKCSGGEQQRIAIARLLLKPCRLVLADEPTGSLDFENKKIIIELLLKLKEQGKTILMVTHDLDISSYADRTIHLGNNTNAENLFDAND